MAQPAETPSEAAKALPDPPAWTIMRLLEWTTNFLRERGSPSPRLDAEVLLAHARGCQRIELYTAFDQPASDELRESFRNLVKQRAQGAPVAYLVGAREFFSRSFGVGPGVLVPRPETEFIIVTLHDLVQREGRNDVPFRLVDVGTGSGILAITAALEFPLAEVWAVDLCPAALAIAEENVRRHGLESRVQCRTSDMLANLRDLPPVDFILSNPPYVSTSEYLALPPEVRDFEPRLALVAGDEGTEVIARLIPQSAERLQPGGWLICEISPMIESRVVWLLEQDGRFSPAQVRRDLAHLPRVVYAQRSSGS